MNESNRNPKPDPPGEEALFQAAAQLSGAERAAFLSAACQGDPVLRERLEALLSANEQTDAVLATEAEPGLLRSEASAQQARATIKLELADAPDEAVGQILGRYKLLEKVGEGGCGVVYVAEQIEPVRRRVALKVIKLGMDTKAVVARFEAERQALAMMDHPNIAKVLDAGTTETGRPYFVMELVRGIRITDYCDQANLSAKERIDLFIKVCQAIQHAHQKGIIHRDIKPSNILVTLHDGMPVPKVIDFGIAKATEGRLTDATVYTQLHQFIGTPAYMSPEQAEMSGLDIDTRSDIYSLGVLLYELLAGSTPFDAKELVASGIDAMRKTIREKEPMRPSTRLTQELVTASRQSAADPGKDNGDALTSRHYGQVEELIRLLRGDLDWIVMKCLEKDRTRRYETANGLAADLQRHLHNEPVTARPPSNAYRFQKMVRRNKLVFGAAAAVGAAVLGGLAVSTYLFVEERRAHGRALAAENTQSQLREQAVAESNKAKSEAERAEAAATEVKLTLAASDFSLAVRLIEENEKCDALAYLARSLSLNSTNEAVPTRLATLLASQAWWVPILVFKPGGGVAAAQFSPEGKWIVTASGLGAAQVWDAGSGQPLAGPMKPDGTEISVVQFSPDGKRIFTASPDRTWRVWDAQSGQLSIAPPTQPLTDSVWSAQFSADGGRIFTSSHGRKPAAVWDTASGQLVTELKTGGRGFDAKARFSPDGKRILTVSGIFVAQVWDAQSGQPLPEPSEHMGKGQVVSAQFSPDGKQIVTTSMDGTARVWDAVSGQPRGEPLKNGAGVLSACFSPDAKRIVTGSYDGLARVWDARSSQPLTEPLKHSDMVHSVQFSPDGKRILTVSGESAYLWSAVGGPALARSFKTDSYSQFSPDGKRLLTVRSVKSEEIARVWDVPSDRPLGEPFKPSASLLFATAPVVQFSRDGEKVLTISQANAARVWDARSGQALTGPLQHSDGVRTAQFSPDGTKIVTASSDRTARIWDAVSGQLLAKPLNHGGIVNSAQFSPDGKHIVTASGDHTAGVWDAQSGQPLSRPLEHGDTVVNSAQFSLDGKWIVTAAQDGTVRVWDAQNGQLLTGPLKHNGSVVSAQFSPDGKRIVTASWGGTAQVWDAASGLPLTPPLKHKASVSSAQFSSDGQRIVTSSWDHYARVWDAVSGQPLTQPLKHGNMVLTAQFSPDGKWIFTTSLGAACAWDIAPSVAPLPDWLPQLAEAISGETVNRQGMLQQTKLNRGDILNQLRQRLNQESDADQWVQWGRWFLSEPTTRTISPFCKITVPEYIEQRLADDTADSLAEAEELSMGNRNLSERIAQALSTLEQRQRFVMLESDALALTAQGNLAAAGTNHAEALEISRKLKGPEDPGTLEVMQNLAESYCFVGRYEEAIALMEKVCGLEPKNTDASLTLATWQTWFGQDADYQATRRHLVQLAEGTDQASTAERAAKAYCLRPSTDATLLTKVLKLAQQAVELGNHDSLLPWCQLGLGLAEHRNRQYAAAEQTLTIVEQSAGEQKELRGTARLLRAMSLFQQDKMEEARKLLSQAQADVPPLPADERKPLVEGKPVSRDVLILWLAYKEANSLLNEDTAPKP